MLPVGKIRFRVSKMFSRSGSDSNSNYFLGVPVPVAARRFFTSNTFICVVILINSRFMINVDPNSLGGEGAN